MNRSLAFPLPQKNRRRWPQPLLLASALAACLGSPLALAQTSSNAQPQWHFQLPTQNLRDALLAFSRQTGIEIIIEANAAQNLQAPALNGQYSASDALNRLLAGSGLVARSGASGVISIHRASDNGVIETGVLQISTDADGRGSGISAAGVDVISRRLLDQQPNYSGSLEDSLRLLPEVKFDLAAQRAMQMGEIKPPLISLSGGKPYENAYLIDGLGNNNYITPPLLSVNGRLHQPRSEYTRNVNSTPEATPQSYNLNVELLENVEVHDSRIPVKYSGFTGGIIAAETRKPDSQRVGGQLYWRHTQDDWAKQLYDPRAIGASNDFQTSYEENRQPRFIRNTFGFNLNLPINSRLASLISYDTQLSLIPLTYYPGDQAARVGRDQRREAKTLFVSLGGNFANGLDSQLSFVHYDYKGSYYENRAIRSGHDEAQETYDLSLKLSAPTTTGQWTLKAKHGFMSSMRDTETNVYMPWRTYGDKNWGDNSGRPAAWGKDPNSWRYGWMTAPGYSTDGSFYGSDMDFDQRSVDVDFSFERQPFKLGNSEHRLSFGLNTRLIWGEVNTEESFTWQSGNFLSLNHPLAPGQEGVSYNWERTGGQLYDHYLSSLDITPAYHRKARNRTFSLWLEDAITLGNLRLRPGLRLDYDDQFRNRNLAPRMFASWHIGGRDNLQLHAGTARYYGGPSLYYSLYRDLGFYRMTRTDARDVQPDGLLHWGPKIRQVRFDTAYEASEMKTPHADEFSIGMDYHGPAGFSLNYNFVRRLGRDGIVKKIYPSENRVLASNLGRTYHSGHTLALSNDYFEDHHFRLSAQWSRTFSNYADFSTAMANAGSRNNIDYSRAFFKGELIDAARLPLTNFNPPLQVVAYHQGRFGEGFELASTLTWTGGTPRLLQTSLTRMDDGMDVYGYSESRMPSHLSLDMNASWVLFKHGQHSLRLGVEGYNLFNSKRPIARRSITNRDGTQSHIDTYAPGRSFAARLDYRF